MIYIIYISYNGSNFIGSQKQLNFKTLHDHISFFLYKNKKNLLKIYISSRTDKNVNVLFKVIQLCSKKKIIKNNFTKISYYLNINGIKQVSKKFHVIYSAINRIYCYIFDFYKNFYKLLEVLKIINLYNIMYFCKYILGVKNFIFFKSFEYNKNFCYTRIIFEINFYKIKNFLYFTIKGNAFLYNMVRNIISYILFIVYNDCLIYNFYMFFFLKYNFYLQPIFSNSLFLIYTKYPF